MLTANSSLDQEDVEQTDPESNVGDCWDGLPGSFLICFFSQLASFVGIEPRWAEGPPIKDSCRLLSEFEVAETNLYQKMTLKSGRAIS